MKLVILIMIYFIKNGMTLEKIIEMEGKQVEIYVKLNEFKEEE